MPSAIQHSNLAHQTACYAALNTWMQAMATGGNTSQSAARAADVAFYRAVIVSCKAQGIEGGVFREALVELGTGGI